MKVKVIREKMINGKNNIVNTDLDLKLVYDVLDLVEEIETGLRDNWLISIVRQEIPKG